MAKIPASVCENKWISSRPGAKWPAAADILKWEVIILPLLFYVCTWNMWEISWGVVHLHKLTVKVKTSAKCWTSGVENNNLDSVCLLHIFQNMYRFWFCALNVVREIRSNICARKAHVWYSHANIQLSSSEGLTNYYLLNPLSLHISLPEPFGQDDCGLCQAC